MSQRADHREPTATPPLVATRSHHAVSRVQPGDRIGSWEVVGVLGEGATGVVYEVVHLKLHTRRALKVLSWAHPTLQARLLTEGRAQASLVHPNVVTVIDLVTLGNVPALLLELVDGPSLEEWLDEHEPSPAEAEEIFRGIVAAVATAHAAGLVHRDLKPANVLMARRGERWIPKVTDFGLAKETNADPSLTGHGATMGTPGYMAPEQIRNSADVDERADIFALGCLLFQLLSGEQPHPGDDPFAIMNAVAAGRVARIERLVPGLPPRFYRTVRRAMALDPEQRPRTCDQLLTLLDPPRPTALVQQPPSGPSWMSLLALAMVLPLIGSLVLLGPLFEIARPSPPVPARAQLAPQPILPAVAQPPRAPEPWVADDVDVAWLMPVLPVAAEPTPDAPRSTAVRAKPAARPGSSVCGSGWAPLPWYARSPDEGAWALRRDLDVHEGTPDEPGAVACVLPEGSIVEVEGGIVRGQSGRWIRLASVSAP